MILGALLASAILGGFWGWSARYAPTAKQKEECYDAAKQSGQKSDECKTFWERTTSDPVDLFTLVLAASTIGLWVATIALYIAAEKAARSARDALDLANREFLSTHRPRIVVREMFVTPDSNTFPKIN
jgi:hypothetical protein